MKPIGLLPGTILLALAMATGSAPPGHATIGCNYQDDPRFPRASLLVENNLILPVEVSSAGWPSRGPFSYAVGLVGDSVPARAEGRFLYGLFIGRNVVTLRVVVDGRIFEAVQEVYVNNQESLTCQRTYKVIITQHTFPAAVIGTGPQPVVEILEATYGENCGAPRGNATGHVAGECNGKSSCKYRVYYKILGDPAFGCEKTFEVVYRCPPDLTRRSCRIPKEAGWGGERGRPNHHCELVCGSGPRR